MLRFKTSHLPTHGAGPLYQWTLAIGRRAVRFSSGGYGYVRAPFGQWSILPHVKAYRGQAYYLNWLHFSLSYLPNWIGC